MSPIFNSLKKEKLKLIFGIFFTVLTVIFALLLGTKVVIPGPDSKVAILSNPGEELAFSEGLLLNDTFVAILGHKTLEFDNPEFIKVRESLFALLKSQKNLNNDSPLFINIKSVDHSLIGDEIFISEDRRQILFIANVNELVSEAPAAMKNLGTELKEWSVKFKSFNFGYISKGVVSNELFDLINRDLDKSLFYTIPITIAVLLWTFCSVAATLVTLSITLLSLITALSISGIFSNLCQPISATAAQLVVLLVMAVGTDYNLFYISRVRSEVRKGKSYPEALEITNNTTGKTILWSGITVVLSLFGLFLMGDTVLTSMAAVSIISVFITLLYSLLFLPSILNLIGRGIEFGSFRAKFNKGENKSLPVLMWSIRNPKTAIFTTLIFLTVISSFCFKINLGSTVQPLMMPKAMQTASSYSLIKKYFPKAVGLDLNFIINTRGKEKIDIDEIKQEFFDSLLMFDNLNGPIQVDKIEKSNIERSHFLVEGSSSDLKNIELVHTIKNKLIPEYLNKYNLDGFLSGTLEYVIVQKELYQKRTFLVFSLILFLSFILLLVIFESLVIPLKAILLNLISTTSSFGILVLIFQDYGFKYGVIESFVPGLLFSILFGLSMDYHLLLLFRVKEEYEISGSMTTAVKNAVLESYGVINSAAIVMVSVFATIAMLELPVMKQLGIGLAFAVLIDATIIRSILLPASMIFLGKWNWYLPSAVKKLVRWRK